MDRLAEIKRLYYNATAATIQKDLARAVGLLKELDEGDRERAAVFMDGLSQMRSEWGLRGRPPRGRGGRKRR
jgi:hypothetical protein